MKPSRDKPVDYRGETTRDDAAHGGDEVQSELGTVMRTTAPVEHFTMMLPPGIPTKQFAKYAEAFANEVIPAFR
jgi:hypothetical protein